MQLTKTISFVLAGHLLIVSALAIADVVPIVSPGNPVDSLAENELANIFLGKTSRFPNGENAVPLDQSESSSMRNEFYSEHTGKSAAQIKAHWSKMIFTGRGKPPRMFDSSDEIKQWVAQNPNAIGYIDRDQADDSVKILQVK